VIRKSGTELPDACGNKVKVLSAVASLQGGREGGGGGGGRWHVRGSKRFEWEKECANKSNQMKGDDEDKKIEISGPNKRCEGSEKQRIALRK
jgi:hypothetical protein